LFVRFVTDALIDVSFKGRGRVEVIEIADCTVPAPNPGEVRIEVRAAAVNPTDIVLRNPPFEIPFPLGDQIVPGMDAAGIIESVGPGETRRHVGDRVMAPVMHMRPEGGAQSRYIVVPSASVVPIPHGVSLVEASTLPMNGLTALFVLEIAALKAGQWLAITGGAGFLAYNMIVVAKRKGLKVVVDAKPEEAALVRSYGADVVVNRGAGFAEEIRAAVPAGVDALLDTACLNEQCFSAIRDNGLYVPVRPYKGPADRGIEAKPVFVPLAFERTDWLEDICRMVEAGVLQPRVAGEYPIERAADAHRALQVGGLRGRPVLIF
jgi:NADPH:quinone reductase-like Zn-dependent oxidoreductase